MLEDDTFRECAWTFDVEREREDPSVGLCKLLWFLTTQSKGTLE